MPVGDCLSSPDIRLVVLQWGHAIVAAITNFVTKVVL